MMNLSAFLLLALACNFGLSQKNENGILAFKSMEHLEKTLQSLGEDFANWDPQPSSQEEADPSDDYLAKKYLDKPPKITPWDAFESRFKFFSLRRKWIQDAFDWAREITSEELPRRADPAFMPELAATVFNANGEIKIGDTYYRATAQGQEEFKILKSLINARGLAANKQSLNSPIGEGRLLQSGADCCGCNRQNSGWHQVGNLGIDWAVGHWCFPYWAFYLPAVKITWARSWNWRRIWFFGWHWIILPRSTTVSSFGACSTYGTINCIRVENLCLQKKDFNPNGDAFTGWTPFLFHFKFVSGWSKPGWVHGLHSSPGITYYSSV